MGRAQRRPPRFGRVTAPGVGERLQLLASLPITIDDGDMKTGIGSIVALARKHGLSSHDAAYLELAMRTAVPLATMDKGLRKAAEAVGMVCLPPNG